MFKNREEYLALRNNLMTEAEGFIKEGKTEDADTKMEGVKALDADYEKLATAQANLKALAGAPPVATPAATGTATVGVEEDEDVTNSMPYRKAFMNYVLHGQKMPSEFVNAATGTTTTTEGGATIPTTLVQKIIEKMEATGMILSLVTRTAYKGGAAIPVSLVKPTAEWVAEGADATGAKLDVKSASMITFSYYKLKCKVAITLEMSEMAIPAFETMLVNNVSTAMTKALEQAIISGNGSGKPKGILAETAPAGQNLDVAKAKAFDYKTLTDAESKLPLAYETGAVWVMTKQTFMSFVGMVDTAGQPIARVNYGISGKPERMLLGRTVICNDYMTSVDAVTADTVVAFLFDMSQYVLNTNYGVTITKYVDEETDDRITKAVMLVDGKVVDKNSLVTITKKAA